MRRLLAACLVVVAEVAVAAQADAAATVRAVRQVTTPDSTRLIVECSAPVPHRLRRQAAQPRLGVPPRLYVDLVGAQLGAAMRFPEAFREGPVVRLRVTQEGAVTRLILDVPGLDESGAFAMPDPFRLVIDVRGTPRVATPGEAPNQPAPAVAAPAIGPVTTPDTVGKRRAGTLRPGSGQASRRPREPFETARTEPAFSGGASSGRTEMALGIDNQPVRPEEPPSSGGPSTSSGQAVSKPALNPVEGGVHRHRFKVVVDPGHGGKDPGALGVGGIAEKDVVLTIAQRLKTRLEAVLDMEVVLTRDQDVFLSLEERTARANTERADLFISIHANASENTSLSGVETYYLNNTNDHATIRLAQMENGLRTVTGHGRYDRDASFILSDLIQRYKVQESVAFAEHVQRGLVGTLEARGMPANNLGVKRGPFYVLVGAGMPCVLVETAFITHPTEGRRLGRESYQDAIAEGLLRGIRRFVENARVAENL